MKRRLGEDFVRMTEEKVAKDRRSFALMPRTSGLSERDIMLLNVERKAARESGSLTAIRASFGAKPLGRISKMALGLIPNELPARED